MGRFNAPTAPPKPDTINRAGGAAYDLSNEAKLVSILLTSFLNDQHYRSGKDTMSELVALVGAVDPKFAAKAAIFARDTFGMRSVTHVVAAELAGIAKGTNWMRPFYHKVIVRPDDATEILAYWLGKYGKPVPNVMRRGIGDVLTTLSPYALGKYKAEGKQLSMVDVVNLCHPKHSEALAALMKGELAAPDTWEVALTKTKGDAEKKGQEWTRLLTERKLGYMALLRNVRNICKDAPEAAPLLAERLVDRDAIHRSRLFPYRFLTAIEEVEGEVPRDVLIAMHDAADLAVGNVPKLSGKTLIAVDNSGSMQNSVAQANGKRGQPVCALAGILAASLYRANDADLVLFSDGGSGYRSFYSYGDPQSGFEWMNADPRIGVVELTKQIKLRSRIPRGTDFTLPFKRAEKAYDRIVILSDMQGWKSGGAPSTAYKEYRQRTGADPFIYSIDLAGYGTAMFPAKKVAALYGFSDKVFDFMGMAERGSDALVAAVKEIEL